MRQNWNEMAGFFFTFIEECCVVIEKNIDKKLANRISHQIWYQRCLKGKFGRGVQIFEGGPIPLADLDRGVQIRCDTGKGIIDGSGYFSFLNAVIPETFF